MGSCIQKFNYPSTGRRQQVHGHSARHLNANLYYYSLRLGNEVMILQQHKTLPFVARAIVGHGALNINRPSERAHGGSAEHNSNKFLFPPRPPQGIDFETRSAQRLRASLAHIYMNIKFITKNYH